MASCQAVRVQLTSEVRARWVTHTHVLLLYVWGPYPILTLTPKPQLKEFDGQLISRLAEIIVIKQFIIKNCSFSEERVFSVLYHCNLNIFGFLTVKQNKPFKDFWETGIDILLTINQQNNLKPPMTV